MSGDARDPGYFDALYAANPDPWRFETSDYETAKYADTIAALPRQSYRSAIEVGCSIGVLTQRLAARCEALLGVDVAQVALDQAAARCAGLPQVRLAKLRMPDEMPAGRYDLVMLSEVLYYFDPPTLERLAEKLSGLTLPEADVVLVHWLGPTPDYPQTGDEAVDAFLKATASWTSVTQQERREDYRLDVLRVARGEL